MDQQERLLLAADLMARDLMGLKAAAQESGSNLNGVDELIDQWFISSAPYRGREGKKLEERVTAHLSETKFEC